jgi:hypothetical protein
MTQKGEPKQLLTRYALTGGALGLYFGLFFRPLREANFTYALFLALLVAVVMSGLHLWQKRPSLATLPAYFASTFIKVALALTLLEGRHLVYDWGGVGRLSSATAVTIFTVIVGAATGLWFAYAQTRQTSAFGKE